MRDLIFSSQQRSFRTHKLSGVLLLVVCIVFLQPVLLENKTSNGSDSLFCYLPWAECATSEMRIKNSLITAPSIYFLFFQDVFKSALTNTGIGRVKVAINCASPGILAICNKYHPWLKAWFDGKETAVLQANYVLQAEALTAGGHDGCLSFRPKWVITRIAFPLCAWGVILTALLAAVARSRGKIIVCRFRNTGYHRASLPSQTKPWQW